jgi:pilus assembly protein TadC
VIKIGNLLQRISKKIPDLDLKLKQVGMKETPEQFVKKILISSLYISFGILFSLWLFLFRIAPELSNALLLFSPVVFIVMFLYFLKTPDVMIVKKQREINSEIVFAGRFLIIELESGVPLYDAFKNVSRNYPIIGKYFTEITNKIDLGTQMEDALNEAVEFTPSANFRKILWQIINAQQTGADISTALKSVVDQITKEQLIEIKEYGRRLNPLAMFYMIIAVILPSIGITMFIILSTFLELTLELPVLISIAVFLGFMQFMFLAMIKSTRPSVEL